MTTNQALIKIRKLIEDPQHWLKRAYARGASGRSIDPSSRRAVSFCLSGAVEHVFPEASETRRETYKLIREAVHMCGHYSMEGFNDNNDHQAVIGLLDQLIGRTKQEEQVA